MGLLHFLGKQSRHLSCQHLEHIQTLMTYCYYRPPQQTSLPFCLVLWNELIFLYQSLYSTDVYHGHYASWSPGMGIVFVACSSVFMFSNPSPYNWIWWNEELQNTLNLSANLLKEFPSRMRNFIIEWNKFFSIANKLLWLLHDEGNIFTPKYNIVYWSH